MLHISGRLRVVLALLLTFGTLDVLRDRTFVRRELQLDMAKNASFTEMPILLNKPGPFAALDDTTSAALGIKLGPFPVWNTSKPLPCFPLEPDWNRGKTQRKEATTGILFAKPPKVGSTTAASVTLRIASRAGRHVNRTLCKNRVQHSQIYKMGYDRRDQQNSVLWSIVREPTSRTISQFFHFHVSRRNKSATDEVFIDFIRQRIDLLTAFQLKYLVFTKDIDNPVRMIEEIFQQYNLIGVTERFDESVVVLQMLLGLDATDVMYLSVKGSGGYDDGRTNNQCTLIQKSFVSPKMKDYFESEEWKAITYWDNVLHRAANQALDMRIDMIGRDEFNRNMIKFRALKEQVDKVCGANVKLPCSTTGEKRPENETDCIYDDMGCAFKCMDSLDEESTAA